MATHAAVTHGRSLAAVWGRIRRTCNRLGSATATRTALVALVAWTATLVYGTPAPRIMLHLEMLATAGVKGEIFYRAHDEGFVQARSAQFQIVDDGTWRDYYIPLPAKTRIDSIRIDPAVEPGAVEIRALEIRQGHRVQWFSGRQLHSAMGAINQLQAEVDGEQDLSIYAMGGDPYLEIALQRPVGSQLAATLRTAVLMLAAALAWLLLEFVARCWSRKTSRQASDPPRDGDLLTFDGRILTAFLCIAVTASVFVGLKLHQSSIGAWEEAYPYAPVEQDIDLGSARRIRVDEWRVLTPWVLNQVLNGSPHRNPNIGGESAPLLASVPLAGIVGLPQLKYAGFLFLDLERGFSWWWAYKSFALVFSLLWLCLLLTRGNMPASLLGTAWIYWSSYTQWWFSSGLPEILSAFAFGTIGALYLLFSARRAMITVGAVLVFYSATNLALNLYPPFVVTLGYLSVAIVAGYAIEGKRYSHFVRRPAFRASAAVATMLAIAAYGWIFYQAAETTIHAMLDTVYPGKRISTSGAVPAVKVMDGFFEPFRISEDVFPRLPSSYNASEASGHVIMLPLLLILVPLATWFRRDNALLVSILAFCAIAFAWITVQLPEPVNATMQAAGWASATPKRTVMALGVGAILLYTVLLARRQQATGSGPERWLHWLTVPACVAAVFWYGAALRQLDPGFFTWKIVTLGCLVAGLLAASLARGSMRLAIAGVAILALPAITVNPLVTGITSLTDKPILVAARKHSTRGDKWIVVGDNSFAQGLKAQGLMVFAGTNYLPDSPSMAKLDPDALHSQVWNRYATIRVNSKPGVPAPEFSLPRADQIRITLDICGRQVKELGITLVAYTDSTPTQDLSCLEGLPSPRESKVRLFRLKR